MSRSFPVLAAVVIACLAAVSNGGDFYGDFDVIWGGDHVSVLEDGGVTSLTLDTYSGSGFQSRDEYLFGEFSMDIKLVPGDSAGTVASFYLTSGGEAHDEIDFEFLGNLSGDPYVLHTNVFTQGKGDREQQFYLWFDPTADFHTYTILWNSLNIIFSVDGTPVREFNNYESSGIAFPSSQPMKIHGSLWDGEAWATRHGMININWAAAPFVASYRSYAADACVWALGSPSCPPDSSLDGGGWMNRVLGPEGRGTVAWVRQNYMVYDYCNDPWRFPQGLPAECSLG